MENNSSGGIGFFGLLLLVLITLKLTKVITIGWGWVFAIPFLSIVGIVILFFILALILHKAGMSK